MKRTVLSCFIVLLLPILFVCTVFAAGFGDVTGDGGLDAADARAALRAAVGLDQLSREQTLRADADHSGKVNAADARLILRVVVGLDRFSHAFGSGGTETVRRADCLHDGLLRRYCTCGEYEEEEIPSPGGHEMLSTGAVLLAPTCTEDGVEILSCRNCGYEEEAVIPAPGHDFEASPSYDKEPTCLTGGMRSRHCLRCGLRTDIELLPKLPHDFGPWITDENGLTQTRRCTGCEETETRPIP